MIHRFVSTLFTTCFSLLSPLYIDAKDAQGQNPRRVFCPHFDTCLLVLSPHAQTEPTVPAVGARAKLGLVRALFLDVALVLVPTLRLFQLALPAPLLIFLRPPFLLFLLGFCLFGLLFDPCLLGS